MRKNKPIFGIIHAPAINQTFWGGESIGSFFLEGDSNSDIEKINASTNLSQEIRMVTSRSHPNQKLKYYLEMLGEHKMVSIGSSLKFCMIARGAADCYLRLGPTSEWDTAAGDAIVKAANGTVKTIHGLEINYNKSSNILNPDFIAASNEELVIKIIDIIRNDFKKIDYER